jgi:hypothetical protein
MEKGQARIIIPVFTLHMMGWDGTGGVIAIHRPMN